MTAVIRIRNAYGEYLTTPIALDHAMTKFLPASINDMRGVMQGNLPAADDYAEVDTVSEFLIMVAATAPDLIAWDAPKPPWKVVLFGEDECRGNKNGP